MHQQYDESAKVHLDRDATGVARNLLHVDEVFVSSARTAQLAAREYLEKFGPTLGLKLDELNHIGLRPERRPTDVGVEYRFLQETSQFDATTVTFSQTCLGLPVWEAGLAVHILQNPFRVIGAQSTAHLGIEVARPAEKALKAIAPVSEETLARRLGLSEKDDEFDRASLKIERQQLYVYRYEKDKRVRQVEVPQAGETRAEGEDRERKNGHDHVHLIPIPPLPPVPKEIAEGGHYVLAAVYFKLGAKQIPELRWVALVETQTQAVLLLRAFIESMDGLVFVQDPMTTDGGPRIARAGSHR